MKQTTTATEESDGMAETENQIKLQAAIEQTSSQIDKMEDKVEALKSEKRDVESSEISPTKMAKRVRKLQSSITLKEELIDT